MKRMIRYFTLLPALFAYSLVSWANQGAILLNDSHLMSQPSLSAQAIVTLTKDTHVILLKRKGGWYQVQTEDNQQGWLRMLKVRFLSDKESNDRSIAKILRETAIMPPASGISTGVRGVSDELLTSPEEGPVLEFENLENFVPVEESVKAFADQGSLENQESVVLPAE